MKANYNVTGNDRKALVAAIENLTGDKAIYMRMPTCAYEIGDITVDKEGSVTPHPQPDRGRLHTGGYRRGRKRR